MLTGLTTHFFKVHTILTTFFFNSDYLGLLVINNFPRSEVQVRIRMERREHMEGIKVRMMSE
jgi:hypothetical protein